MPNNGLELNPGERDALSRFGLNAAPIMVLQLDHAGLIQTANDFAGRIIGESLPGLHLKDLLVLFDGSLDWDILINEICAASPVHRCWNVKTTNHLPLEIQFELIDLGNSLLVLGAPNFEDMLRLRHSFLDLQKEWHASARESLKTSYLELERLERRYRLLLSSLGEGVIGMDEHGRHSFINPAAAGMLGYLSNELEGQPCHSIWQHSHPDGSPYPEKESPLLGVLVTGISHSCNLDYFLRKDGCFFPVEYICSPLIERKSVTGAVLVFKDITERKMLEKQLTASANEIQDLYDHSPCGYHSVDREGTILRMNQTELDWLGYTREEVIGKMKVTDFFTEASQERFKKTFPKFLMDGHIENLEFELVAKNGVTKPVSVAETAMCDDYGNFVMSRTVLYDVSELKRVQEALLSMDRRKDEFLAMLAHELRNPLAPIRNTVQLLKMQDVKEPILKQSYEIIDRQVTQLSRLLDDLLDVARIMQGKMTLDIKPFPLNDIVEIAVETCRPLINSRKQKLNISLPTMPQWIKGDSGRLTQVIANLLNNAAIYTNYEGEISLSATSKDSILIVQVKDNGMGIAPDLLPYVFDIFTQANQGLAHSQGGIGVGLTLVRRLVELHGGTVTAESAGVGLGSLFTVQLPVFTLDATISDSMSIKPTLPKNHFRMMIVEDYASAAESLALVLKMERHQIEIADCGMKAIEIARIFHPEVALIDIGLPDIDGFEVAKRLRELPETQNTLLIALTGYGQDKDRERASLSGFDHYLLKPVDFEKLFELLASFSINHSMVAHQMNNPEIGTS